ncbi:hypothetical protein D3C73_1622830 [compost metagenome]
MKVAMVTGLATDLRIVRPSGVESFAPSWRDTRANRHMYRGAMISSWAANTDTTGVVLPTAYKASGTPMFPALT